MDPSESPSEIPTIDVEARTVSHRGVTVSWELFEHFAGQANVGTIFRFVKHEGAVITVENLGHKEVI